MNTRLEKIMVVFLAWLIGMAIGAQMTLSYSRSIPNRNVACFTVPVQTVTATPAPLVCDTSEADKLRAQLDESNDAHRKLIGSLKTLALSDTVLYRLETPGLPLLNGAITVSPGSSNHPVGDEQPEWVLPLRIRPTCVRCGANAEWAWINKQTHAVEGPYRVQ